MISGGTTRQSATMLAAVGLWLFVCAEDILTSSTPIRIGNADQKQPEHLLARLVQDISFDKLPQCNLVFAHDFEQVPMPFQSLLAHFSERYLPSLCLALPSTFTLPPIEQHHHFEFRRQYYWDLHSEQWAGPCRLHLLTTNSSEDLNSMHQFVAQTIIVDLHEDHLVVWTREDPEGALQTDKDSVLYPFTFKLGVKPIDGHLHLSTICFFCQDGYPMNMPLGSYPGMEVKYMFPDSTLNMHGFLTISAYLEDLDWKAANKKVAEKGLMSLKLSEAFIYHFCEAVNCTWRLYEGTFTPEMLEKSRLDNGTWMTPYKEMLTGESNYFIGSFYQAGIKKQFKYTYPCLYTKYVFLTRLPNPVWSWKTIFWPYQAEAWIVIVCALIFATAVTWKFLHIEAKLLGQVNHGHKGRLFQVAIRYCSSALIEQMPREEFPPGDASRTFILFWFFVAIVITCGYQEMVFAFITIPEREILPVTFEELWKSKYDIGVPFMSGMVYTFLTKRIEGHTYYHEILKKLTLTSDGHECITHAMKRDYFSCMGLDFFLELDKMKVVDSEGHIHVFDKTEGALSIYTGASFPKDNPCASTVNNFLVKVVESGLANTFKSNEVFTAFRENLRKKQMQVAGTDWEDEMANGGGEEEEGRPLTKEQLYGPLGLLIAGWIISAVIFIVLELGSLAIPITYFRKCISRFQKKCTVKSCSCKAKLCQKKENN